MKMIKKFKTIIKYPVSLLELFLLIIYTLDIYKTGAYYLTIIIGFCVLLSLIQLIIMILDMPRNRYCSCIECGTHIDIENRYCPFCGTDRILTKSERDRKNFSDSIMDETIEMDNDSITERFYPKENPETEFLEEGESVVNPVTSYSDFISSAEFDNARNAFDHYIERPEEFKNL